MAGIWGGNDLVFYLGAWKKVGSGEGGIDPICLQVGVTLVIFPSNISIRRLPWKWSLKIYRFRSRGESTLGDDNDDVDD